MKSHSYDDVGNINPPDNFEYTEILKQGKPHHEKFDDFYRRHPFMDVSKRAKIFSPFDALKGFGEATAGKRVQYQPKIILGEEIQDEISRRLDILHRLTLNSRIARKNHIVISVTYFVPCNDKNHESYGYCGSYLTIEGVCKNIDSVISKTITVDDVVIEFDDILSIESKCDIFTDERTY